MSTTIPGNDQNFAATVELPSDGDKRRAQSVNNGLTNLADRTATMNLLKATKLALARAMASTWINGTPKTGSVGLGAGSIAGGINVVNGQNWWIMVGGATGSRPLLLHSGDGGILADAAGVFVNKTLRAAAYDAGNDVWVAVGDATGVDAYVLSTTLGPDNGWARRGNARDINLNAVASGGGTTIAVGDFNTVAGIYGLRSTDGVNFTEIILPGAVATDEAHCVVKGPGSTWVVGGQAGGSGVSLAWRSTDDGATFSAVAGAIDNDIKAVTWNGKNFIFVGADGEAATSADGAVFVKTRNPGSAPAEADIQDVASDPATGLVVATVQGNATERYLLVSEDDGATFSLMGHMPTSENNYDNWPAITQFGGAFLLGRTAAAGHLMARSGALL